MAAEARTNRFRPRADAPAWANVTAATPKPDRTEVAIVGAGPYGLASAAFLRDGGAEVRIFGEPMGYWQRDMPRGMLLRSRWRSSHIADPGRSLTLDAFEHDRGVTLPEHVPIQRFIEYGLWYQQQVTPDVDQRRVERIRKHEGGFELELEDGARSAACAPGRDSG
jgi:cation diffusion facilitator CzcD-associated flavoprotein CzcO